MVLQVALLGSGVLAERTEELPWVQVQLNMLLEVAPVGRLVLAVRAGQRLGPVVDLTGMPGNLMLIGCQVAAALALEGTLTCREEEILDVHMFLTYKGLTLFHSCRSSHQPETQI